MLTNERPYAYIVQNEFYILIEMKQIIRFHFDKKRNVVGYITVALSDAGMHILSYLLSKSKSQRLFPKDEILAEVMDSIYAYSTNQKLWYILNELKSRLNSVGLPDDFITQQRAKGVSVGPYQITELYSRN
ncbi:hypothetical protein SGI62_004393 [Enterobacter hormaechei]|uniref:hypothetical protein n=1 Tax=Enterobacter hormaechei TaxID=158836 RepID=UPI0013D3E271|nr:hypothetical protein [Enterobacter hormaechei]ELV3390472.1 hypothetical protein [Enterobacter hormaechei]